jgi:tripartite-type tricarboxylate transporter receptor subunit TctC
VPSLAEGILPNYDVTTWSGLGAPANLSPDLVARLNAAVRSILSEPAVADFIHNLGNDVSPSTPEAFRARVAGDIHKWADVAKAANIPKI